MPAHTIGRDLPREPADNNNALWRYVEHGLVPQGAILVSPAVPKSAH